MRSDELIDNVARDMTAKATRPALRERVMAAIADAPQGPQYGWLVPAMAAAACLVGATWLMMPGRIADEAAVATTVRHEGAVEEPRAATESSVSERIAEAVTPARGAIALNTSARTTTRGATPALAAAALVWTDTPVAEIPTLPPLAGPPPIVIEPITWDEVMIAPLKVEPIEVKALVIEPLDGSGLRGV